MRSVLITRPQPVADEFAEKLRREGFAAFVAPMMEYVPAAADVSALQGYQALIFTSAQAVQAFSSLSSERNKAVLAVGDATASTATRAGFTHVYSAKGNSVDVASLIRAEASKLGLKRILHLCSADTPDDIGGAVTGLGVEVVRLPVYKAQLVATLPDDVAAALQRGAIDVVLLFSTRTAENFVRLLIQNNLREVSQKLEIICISDQVVRAVHELPWRLVRVARQPRMEAVMQALRDPSLPTKKAVQSERRGRGPDRRQKTAPRDTTGFVDSTVYKGPDRRVALRRAHESRQNHQIWKEKMRFLNRTMLTCAFMFIAIVLAVVFTMAPEYAHLSKPVWVDSVRQRISVSSGSTWSFGNFLHNSVEKVQGTPLTSAVSQIADATVQAIRSSGSTDFSQVLNGIMQLRSKEGGDAAIEKSMTDLRASLMSPDLTKEDDINRVVDKARDKDPTLNAMLGDSKEEDLAAGALLLVLNEFRNNVDSRRPFKDDLLLLKKFAGNDPAMNRSLQRLAPYAEKGVMNRVALQAELKGLAGDIITAHLQGQDISMKQAAQKRFERLALAGSADAVKGESPDAVVARAQIMLDKGDIRGAMSELQSLDGASADAARPWIGDATTYVAADRATDDLTGNLLQGVASSGGLSIESFVEAIKGTLHGNTVSYISPSLAHGDGGRDLIIPQH